MKIWNIYAKHKNSWSKISIVSMNYKEAEKLLNDLKICFYEDKI